MRFNLYRFVTFGIAFSFGLLLLFDGCKPEVEAEAPSKDIPKEVFDLERIKAEGKLTAFIDYSSTSYFIYKGTPMGFEYDLLLRFAEHLGVELDVKPIHNLDPVFDQLNAGEADMVAANLTITKKRLEKVAFTEPHTLASQVLVQRRPKNWRRMTRDQWKSKVITDPIQLAHKKVHIRRNSSFYTRLEHLSHEIGDPILIKEVSGELSTEELIDQVNEGLIDYTIADEHVAKINRSTYPNLDFSTRISFSQKIAWAVRKSSPKLLEEVNAWLSRFRKTTEFAVIYKKYFENSYSYKKRVSSEYYASKSGKISAYDDLVKKYSSSIHWDWMLLSSLIYQESHFDHSAQSWVGAYGLMQLMPETGERYGVDSLSTPEENIRAGVEHLRWLEERWSKTIKDRPERIKFVLASYNVGIGHIIDARNLAKKYGKNPLKWEDNVEEFLLKKSDPNYYRDPIVKCGYCRGIEPYRYVREILKRYEQYRTLILQ
jgi:membrane-bound lytic murein transglycosylase F